MLLSFGQVLLLVSSFEFRVSSFGFLVSGRSRLLQITSDYSRFLGEVISNQCRGGISASRVEDKDHRNTVFHRALECFFGTDSLLRVSSFGLRRPMLCRAAVAEHRFRAALL